MRAACRLTQRLNMSFPYTSNIQDAKNESLLTQRDYLNLLRIRHQHWMSSANTPATKKRHEEIIALIEQLAEHYSHLIEAGR